MAIKLSENDIINQRFGRLTLIRITSTQQRIIKQKKDGFIYKVLCKCDCGNIKDIRYADIKSGHTKSCGCLAKETSSNRSYKHGHTANKQESRTWTTWRGMIDRCYTKSSTSYKKYGAKGILVCDRWRSFINFLEDMGERPAGKTLDRINGNEGYSPENCRWATAMEQSNNQKSNVKLIIDCREMNVSQAMRYYGVYTKSGVYYSRIERGWPVDKVFSVPVKKSASVKVIQLK